MMLFSCLECTPNQAEIPDVILVLFPGVSHCRQKSPVTYVDDGRVTENLVFLYSNIFQLVWTKYL